MDFERIRKHDGYVYWWDLNNYLKPDKYGDLSVKLHRESDCKLFRLNDFIVSYHTQPMVEAIPSKTINSNLKKEWNSPSPKSVLETILKPPIQRNDGNFCHIHVLIVIVRAHLASIITASNKMTLWNKMEPFKKALLRRAFAVLLTRFPFPQKNTENRELEIICKEVRGVRESLPNLYKLCITPNSISKALE